MSRTWLSNIPERSYNFLLHAMKIILNDFNKAVYYFGNIYWFEIRSYFPFGILKWLLLIIKQKPSYSTTPTQCRVTGTCIGLCGVYYPHPYYFSYWCGKNTLHWQKELCQLFCQTCWGCATSEVIPYHKVDICPSKIDALLCRF